MYFDTGQGDPLILLKTHSGSSHVPELGIGSARKRPSDANNTGAQQCGGVVA